MTKHETLADALIAAQAEATSLKRDGKNQHQGYKYATADQVFDIGRQLLSSHGLAWSRISSTLQSPSLAPCDIGKQHYVGDVVIDWVLTHASGTISGRAVYPVIAAANRPHEKATAASITYGCGQILAGLLCWDREDEKTAVDRRADGDQPSKPKQKQPPAGHSLDPDGEPFCTGKASGIARAIRERAKEVATITGDKPGHVYAGALREAGIPPLPDGSWPQSEQLRVSQGQRVKDILARMLDEARGGERLPWQPEEIKQ